MTEEFRPSFENYESLGIDLPNYVAIGELMMDQIKFEISRIGDDGTLFDHNSVEFILTRGVQGEAQEALEETDIEKRKEEFIDILIFWASGAVHMGMSPEEVSRIAEKKMGINFLKYAVENFQGRTVKEGIQHSRDNWKRSA